MASTTPSPSRLTIVFNPALTVSFDLEEEEDATQDESTIADEDDDGMEGDPNPDIPTEQNRNDPKRHYRF